MDFLSDLIAAVPVIGLLWLYNRECKKDHAECLEELQKVNDKLGDMAMTLVPKQPRDPETGQWQRRS